MEDGFFSTGASRPLQWVLNFPDVNSYELMKSHSALLVRRLGWTTQIIDYKENKIKFKLIYFLTIINEIKLVE